MPKRLVREKIDPASISFASPPPGEALLFDCDNIPINNWFSRHSQQEHALFDCRVKHALMEGAEGVVGFYALNLRLENKSEFTDSKIDAIATFKEKVTTVHLQWLAVRCGLERRGLGTILMTSVFEDAYHVMNRVGAHALTVKYIGAASEKLYRKSGMGDYGGSGSSQLFIPAKNIIEFIET